MPLAKRSHRIASLDLLRGGVMVLMTLDHCRALMGRLGNPTDLATTTPLLFLTRWITHFCAPVFVVLAGLSAALWARKVGPERASRFLITRGLWLIFLEATWVSFCWQMRLERVSLLVIWALGASMVGLGLLVRVHRHAPLIAGLVLVLGHNLLAGLQPVDFGALAIPWGLAFAPHSFEVLGVPVGVSYPALPWLGLMALGWAAAPLLVGAEGIRGRRAVLLGGAMLVAFVVLRGMHAYGDPRPWAVQEQGALFTLFSFLDCTKYPPSLQFLLMTLGPALLLLPLLARWRGRFAAPVLSFGRVPMFFYLLHIPLIQVVSFAWIRLGSDAPSLTRSYGGWLLVLVVLYPLCVAWGRLKATRGWWWLRYL